MRIITRCSEVQFQYRIRFHKTQRIVSFCFIISQPFVYTCCLGDINVHYLKND